MKILVIGGDYPYGAIWPLVVAGLRQNGVEADGVGYRSAGTCLRPGWSLWPKRFGLDRRLPGAYAWLENQLYEFVNLRAMPRNRELILTALERGQHDAVLVIKGECLARPLLCEMRRRRPGCRLAIWFLDHPLLAMGNPPRLHREVAEALPEYDLACCFDDYYLEHLQSQFGVKTLHLPLAFWEEQFYPLPGAVKRYPVSLTGSGMPSRNALVRALDEVAVFGPHWPANLPGVHPGVLSPEEVNRVYNETLINLNHNHAQSIWDYNNKLFEITGSGGFLLTDAKRNLAQHFVPGREVEGYHDAGELREKIAYYREHPEQAAAIAAAGHARAQRDHTYRVRMKTLLTALAGL